MREPGLCTNASGALQPAEIIPAEGALLVFFFPGS
jgi:hypothetical protein